MSVYERAIGRARRDFTSISCTVVRHAAASPLARPFLNAYYRRLGAPQRSRFHKRYAKLFRGTPIHAANGVWVNTFLGKRFRMPLTTERFVLDWDSAVSILGNDIEVKLTYSALIESAQRPDVFLDVGGNYGTHSLLFLLHDIRTITFEPNASCHDYFKRLCAMNDVSPDLRPVAIGDEHGEVALVYPQLDTWLGSVSPDVVHTLTTHPNLVTQKVEQQTLDNYLPLLEGQRTLIKIDTEGSECAVLRGAVNVLDRVKPLVIFESVDKGTRREINDYLASHQYSIHSLPWRPAGAHLPLTPRDLFHHAGTNFIAIPL